MYKPQQSTKQWGEGGYYKVAPGTHNAQVVPVSLFWADYADHLAAAVTAAVTAAAGQQQGVEAAMLGE